MAATVSVADATPTSAPAMMSDTAVTAWIAMAARWLNVTGLDPGSLRAACPEGRNGLWHRAGEQGRTDVCEYLKSKGLLDLIDRRHPGGLTPLNYALCTGRKRLRGG